MQRYFAVKKEDNILFLNSDDLYHIHTVMRLVDGAKIEVVFEQKSYLATLFDNKANIIDVLPNEQFSFEKILCIPLLSEQKMSFVLQKATELGVNKIIPVIMERSIVKWESNKQEKKFERWYKICKEASEQSKRVDIPIIEPVTRIEQLSYDGLKLVCSTINKDNSLKKILQSTKEKQIMMIIGPEGGFTKNEETKLVSLGFLPITLGQTVLRVETVPIALLSILNYEMME